LLADDFCQFVRASSGETLHYIALNILCKGDRIAQAKLQMPPMELWTGLITNFKTRLEVDPKDAKDFIALFMEFHFMVGTFDTYCVQTVFELLPQELRNNATEDAKRHLGLFYQRFTAYLTACQDFAKETGIERPIFAKLPMYLYFP